MSLSIQDYTELLMTVVLISTYIFCKTISNVDQKFLLLLASLPLKIGFASSPLQFLIVNQMPFQTELDSHSHSGSNLSHELVFSQFFYKRRRTSFSLQNLTRVFLTQNNLRDLLGNVFSVVLNEVEVAAKVTHFFLHTGSAMHMHKKYII